MEFKFKTPISNGDVKATNNQAKAFDGVGDSAKKAGGKAKKAGKEAQKGLDVEPLDLTKFTPSKTPNPPRQEQAVEAVEAVAVEVEV